MTPLLLPSDIQFNPTARLRYTIGGIPVPGVTTITGKMPKDLTWWASGMACEQFGWLNPKKASKEELAKAAMTAHAKIKGMTPAEYTALLATAYRAHNARKEEAADLGTAAHDWFEKYVKSCIANGGYKPAASPAMPTDARVLNAVNLFLQFVGGHKVRWMHSEVVIGSRRYMFGGKFDAIAEIDGVVYLVDFKTSSGIFYEMCVQTAGYTIGCGEMGIQVDRRLILWVPKTGDVFKAWPVPTPLPLDTKCFLTALDMYHCIQDGEGLMKYEEEKAKAAA